MTYQLVSAYLLNKQKEWQAEFDHAPSEYRLEVKRTLMPLNDLIAQLEKNPEDMKSILLQDKNRFSLASSSALSDVFIAVDKIIEGGSNPMDVMHKEILQVIKDARTQFQIQEYQASIKHKKELQHLVHDLNALPLGARADYLQAKYDEKSMFSTMRNKVIGVLLEKYKALEEVYLNTAAKTIRNPLAASPNRYRFQIEQGPKTQTHDVEEKLPQDEAFTPKG